MSLFIFLCISFYESILKENSMLVVYYYDLVEHGTRSMPLDEWCKLDELELQFYVMECVVKQ